MTRNDGSDDTRVALVIGCDTAGFKARDSVKRLTDTLLRRGYNVGQCENPSRVQLVDAIRIMSRKYVVPIDKCHVLLYFCGDARHIGGVGYLMPCREVDADGGSPVYVADDGVLLSTALRKLNPSGSTLVAFLDVAPVRRSEADLEWAKQSGQGYGAGFLPPTSSKGNNVMVPELPDIVTDGDESLPSALRLHGHGPQNFFVAYSGQPTGMRETMVTDNGTKLFTHLLLSELDELGPVSLLKAYLNTATALLEWTHKAEKPWFSTTLSGAKSYLL